MLVIKKEQVTEMRKASLLDFENRMVTHLRKCFPEQCAAMNEAEIRSEIRLGFQKAVGYRFLSELEICKFTNLMFLFGRDFDTQVEPWVSACRLAGDPNEFLRAWDEAYDALIEQSEKELL
jgi:hypothetical protein